MSLSLSPSPSGVYVHLGNQEQALAIHRAAKEGTGTCFIPSTTS